MAADKTKPFGPHYAKNAKVHVREAKDGKHYWLVKAGNRRIVMVSTDRYDSAAKAHQAFAKCMCSNKPAQWEVYEDKAGKWRWTLHDSRRGAPLGTIAAPYEAFASKGNATKAAKRCRELLFQWTDLKPEGN